MTNKHGKRKIPDLEHEAKESYGMVHGMGHGGLDRLKGMIGGFKKKPKM